MVYDGTDIDVMFNDPYFKALTVDILDPSNMYVCGVLHILPYKYSLIMDQDRYVDGVYLRRDVSRIVGVPFDTDLIENPTFLEVIIALINRMEDITYGTDINKKYIFNSMLKQLGIWDLCDGTISAEYTETIIDIINRFNERKYDINSGGLFNLKDAGVDDIDITKMPLWQQANKWLNIVLK